MQSGMALIVHSQNGAMRGTGHGIRTWQAPAARSMVLLLGNPNRECATMKLIALTHVGPDTPCGEYFRRFWQPVCYADDIADLPLKG
jgi:hypothetical protein